MEALFAYPESSVMLTLAIVAIVLVSVFKEDFFRPSTLYFLVQMIMLGVSYMKFLPMMSDFNYSTWLVWGGGMFCFLVGCYMTDFAWRSYGGPPLQKTVGMFRRMDAISMPGVTLSQFEMQIMASALWALTMYSTESAMMSREGNE